ncbi:MAG: aminotransferase class I/II-fold pyridoxal phosphate-dependent enzyme [Cyclobacteriaceae bacterium]|nr:aminotransferase class I/II-fold pyridoxal phosphate-dependent enzyme [Cyclobacteriaceae bacterium]
MLNLTSRLPDVGTSIFTVMSRMALEHGAINLSQGFPDFPVSQELVDLIYKYLKEGHNQYAPMAGTPALRKAIAEVVKQTYQRPTDFETEITITAGGTEALFSTIAALVQKDDEVIVFDPAYDSYDPSIRLNGGVPKHISLKPPHFAIDWQEVKDAITPCTRLIVINTPHNPTGSILREADLKQLEKIVQAHNIIVLSDEVYERIIFDGETHESVLKYPGLAQHSVAVFSFGKTFHATGWKVGYAVAPAHFTQEIRKAHQFITFSVNTPVQMALAEYLATPAHYLQLGDFYQRKRDYFLNEIKGSSFRPLPCYGSYFQLLSYEGVGTLPEKEMAEWMTKEKKLAPIPVSAFYQNGDNHRLLRFCFAKGEETLAQAGAILRKL